MQSLHMKSHSIPKTMSIFHYSFNAQDEISSENMSNLLKVAQLVRRKTGCVTWFRAQVYSTILGSKVRHDCFIPCSYQLLHKSLMVAVT
jgi:hypothetical protein